MKTIFASVFLLVACMAYGQRVSSPAINPPAPGSTDSRKPEKFNSIVAKYDIADRRAAQFTKKDARRLTRLYYRLSKQEQEETHYRMDDGKLRSLTVEDMLRLKVAGLDLLPYDPNARRIGPRVRQPTLLVVDGEATDVDLSGLDYNNMKVKDYAELINMSPNDIERVAAWHATPSEKEKYGERASGGIVFITTKKAGGK